MFGVNASLLRFWETQFPMLQPKKNQRGKRKFTQQDITLIQQIYDLVKTQGYTLEGAQQVIKGARSAPQSMSENQSVISHLRSVKAMLQTLRQQVERL